MTKPCKGCIYSQMKTNCQIYHFHTVSPPAKQINHLIRSEVVVVLVYFTFQVQIRFVLKLNHKIHKILLTSDQESLKRPR